MANGKGQAWYVRNWFTCKWGSLCTQRPWKWSAGEKFGNIYGIELGPLELNFFIEAWKKD